MMVLPIGLGVLFGAIGFVPLFAATKLVKKIPATSKFGLLGLFLGCIFFSTMLLIIPLIVCAKVAHDIALIMAIAEMVVFLVLVAALGISRIRQK